MISALASAHAFLARALVLYAAILGIWGTIQYFRNRELSGGFRASFLVMAGLTAVQGLLGAISLIGGDRPHNLLHVVYGIFAVLFLPGLFFYAQGGTRRRETIFLASGAWIVAIAYLRGITTG